MRLHPLSLLLFFAAHTTFAARPYHEAAIASAHPMASEAGLEMLRQGGNAIDAAVAAAFTLAVVGPYHSGLGGGGFAVFHLASGKDFAFDFREVAPAAATRDMYWSNGKFVPTLATDGPLSIAVPGAIKGYLELHAKYGRLKRATILAPAIRAARDGFRITPKYLATASQREACLRAYPETARIFLPDGKLPALGTLLRQTDLKKTLEQLAQFGDAAFYRGPLGRSIVKSIRDAGGIMSDEDILRYQTKWRTPLTGSYRGHRIITMPPPSAGGFTLLETFGLLEARGLEGPGTHSVEAVHQFIEALRLAYEDRGQFGADPDFVPVPIEKLLSQEFLSSRSKAMSMERAGVSRPPPLSTPVPPDAGIKNTTHISVIDKAGNAVALTTTINHYFGSCVVAKGTGILLNNEMDDFTAKPGTPNGFGLVMSEANAIGPGRRPVSSMTPTLVFMKEEPQRVMLAVGSPGGSTIPTTVMQVVSHVIDAKLDVVRAVARGRIHHQWLPDEVWVDPEGLEPATIEGLKKLGHTIKLVPPWGDAEAVYVDPTNFQISASSDPRNEGQASGW